MKSGADPGRAPRPVSPCASLLLAAFAMFLLLAVPPLLAEENVTVATISSQPLHPGQISPRLFGNFLELLDDVAPAMWAEMLNDRSFEGVEPLKNRYYYEGEPNFCDREWNRNASWDFDTAGAFNGARSAKLAAARETPASLSQSGLAVKKGMTYRFSGYFRFDGGPVTATVTLKTLLPDGTWMILAQAALPGISNSWKKSEVLMVSSGTTDRAVFELEIRGDGRGWADKLSLMPADQVHGWRHDVVDAVKELHAPILPWGGSIVDPGKYRWKDGIGDRDTRTPFRNKFWGRIDSIDVGIDEFCQLCEAVGTEPLLCVSFSDGPESAHDLVEYCNGDAASPRGAKRAANGHAAPYRVKYWQIGNEISGDKPEYLEGIEPIIRAIKQADPDAAVMSSYPSQKLLDLAGKDLSFVCPHQYTRDLTRADSMLHSRYRMIDSTPGCGHLKIAITEWNVSGGDWGFQRGRQMTLETALMNARHLHVMMRHCDKLEIANRSNLANSFGGATFETNDAGLLRRPSHYVMELYGAHARPMPLGVESPAGGPDLFACASLDKKALTLFAVNSQEKPLDLHLAGNGFENLCISSAPIPSATPETPSNPR